MLTALTDLMLEMPQVQSTNGNATSVINNNQYEERVYNMSLSVTLQFSDFNIKGLLPFLQ